MCNCIEKVNTVLKEKGIKLDCIIMLDGGDTRPAIKTVRIDSKRDKFSLLITNCPFCGEIYKNK